MARIHQLAVRIPEDCSWLKEHEDLYILLQALSTSDEIKKAQRFSHRVDSWRHLVGRNLVRYFLSRIVGISGDPRDLAYGEGPYGKPYLRYLERNIVDFNISHAGNWVIMGAIVGSAEIGIDVVKVELSPGERLEELFSQFREYFSKHEWLQIELSSNVEVRLHSFYQFWALKESYLKATGKGIASVDLSSIEFTLHRISTRDVDKDRHFEGVRRDIHLIVYSTPEPEYKFWLYYLDKEHVVALCCRSEHEYGNPEVISVEQILGINEDKYELSSP